MAQLTDIVSLSRFKRRLSIGQGDTSQDVQIGDAITAASEWLDDRCGPVVQRLVDGVTVGRYATTAAAESTRFGQAVGIFAAWLLRSQLLRSSTVDGYDTPEINGPGEPPVDAIRALLGDDWIDSTVGVDDQPFIGSIRLGVWSLP